MESKKILKNNNLLDNAKKLRKNMTPQEKRLWYDYLRQYPVKIYKQRIVDNYIVDFYCHKAKLVIELDGYSHYTDEGKKEDYNRTEKLKQYGISVLRFSNSDVDNNFDCVCNKINMMIQSKIECE